MTMIPSNEASGVLPFLLDAGPARAAMRGRLVRIDAVASSILERHGYPPGVAELTAEAMALGAALASTMDYDGVFTLQASGDGLIRTLFSDVTSGGAVRGYASVADDASGLDQRGYPAPVLDLMGAGYLAFTVDQGEGGRYQGIVPIEAPDLGAVSLRYFRDSEQIDTAIILAARPAHAAQAGSGGWHAAALLLQRIPETGGREGIRIADDIGDDHWHTACTLMATCSRDELTDPALLPDVLLHRLFHEMGVTVLPFRPLRDECRCSPERVDRMLATLSVEERRELADDDDMITVACEFCKIEHRQAI
ncbi:Hsp33 family molecular chaperone HslO [Alphaproteobacteria bacterium LSUCC0684]